MRNFFITLLILPFTFSCNPKENKLNSVEAETLIESDSRSLIEDEINDNAVGGEGVIFENGGMSFTIESLESTAKEVEEQLNNIKLNTYNSEDSKKNAIESMELNLQLFQGAFCCTTHDAEHCADSKELRKLKSQFGCERFMKKQ